MEYSRDSLWGIVLAGAHAWDNNPFDRVLPRALLPVVHCPLAAYALRWLRSGGISGATICPNSSSEVVRRCLKDGGQLGLDLHYYEDWTPRGPAGCIHDAALPLSAELLVVCEATIIPQFGLSELLAEHRASGAALTVVVGPDPLATPRAGQRLAPLGVYVFSRAAVERIAPAGYQDIKEILIPKLHRSGLRVHSYVCPQVCPRVSDENSYLAVQAWMLEHMARNAAEFADYQRVQEGWVHETARLAANVTLLGPVLIGPASQIDEAATLVGPACLGADCRVAAGAAISRSALWDHCFVGSDAVVDRSILTHRAEVAPEARVYGVVHVPSELIHSTTLEQWRLRNRGASRAAAGSDENLQHLLTGVSGAGAESQVLTHSESRR